MACVSNVCLLYKSFDELIMAGSFHKLTQSMIMEGRWVTLVRPFCLLLCFYLDKTKGLICLWQNLLELENSPWNFDNFSLFPINDIFSMPWASSYAVCQVVNPCKRHTFEDVVRHDVIREVEWDVIDHVMTLLAPGSGSTPIHVSFLSRIRRNSSWTIFRSINQWKWNQIS